MKKMLAMLIFSLIFLTCIAPTLPPYEVIPESEPLYKYGLRDPIARAVASYESNMDPYAVNPHSGASGLMQITPVMIKEVNNICMKLDLPNRYTWKDAFDPDKSVEIWYIVQNYHNPDYDLARACQLWFGTGVQWDGMTWRQYLIQIQKRL